MYNVLLLTVDNHMPMMAPDPYLDLFQIDLEPVDGKLYDACFVYESVKTPCTFKVREGNTIFFPGEPSVIKGYGTPFLRQFDSVWSSRNDLDHNNRKRCSIKTPWRVGLNETLEREGKPRTIRTATEVLSRQPKKSKFMSMVVSDKTSTPLQRARLKLAQVVKYYLTGLVDIYGRGHNYIEDKADALDDYMFSIAIENSHEQGYITEKFIDCIITNTVPLYTPPSDMSVHYPSGYIAIDPWDIQGTINTIVTLSQDPVGHYNSYRAHTEAIKRDYIFKHSIIATIHEFILSTDTLNTSILEKSLVPDQVGYWA